MHFDLKSISVQSIPEALAKVERYRLLNEPTLAESICLDILAIVPDHQQALISLLLARTDQFHLQGVFWNAISDLNDNFGALGYGIVALFVVSWGISFLIYRFKRYDLHARLD
jgi:hypothetical protein